MRQYYEGFYCINQDSRNEKALQTTNIVATKIIMILRKCRNNECNTRWCNYFGQFIQATRNFLLMQAA